MSGCGIGEVRLIKLDNSVQMTLPLDLQAEEILINLQTILLVYIQLYWPVTVLTKTIKHCLFNNRSC